MNCCNSLGKRVIGLLCLLGVVLIWVISGELIEFIFSNQSFSSPFFLTYFNTSLFSIYLLGFLLSPQWWITCNGGGGSPPTWMVWMKWCRRTRGHSSILHDHPDDDDTRGDIQPSTTTTITTSSTTPTSTITTTTPSVGQTMLPKHESEDMDEETPVIANNAEPPPLTIRQVAGIALGFCPLWFGANYLYNLSLSMTSVASATILSTTSSLFTFALSCAMKVEQPTVWKLVRRREGGVSSLSSIISLRLDCW